MHQTFSGSGRRPRQVNLSGRNTNPFAGTGLQSGPQQAILSAHQDRVQRQQQRAELTAAKNLQRTWRGYSSRRSARDAWRLQWDTVEKESQHSSFHASAEASLAALRLLMAFFSAEKEEDVQRLLRYGQKQELMVSEHGACVGESWSVSYLRLEKATLAALDVTSREMEKDNDEAVTTLALLRLLAFIVDQNPVESLQISVHYYQTLSAIPLGISTSPHHLVAYTVAEPLRKAYPQAYQAFVTAYLTLPQQIQRLDALSGFLDSTLLTLAVDHVVARTTLTPSARLWLLGQLIYLLGTMNGSLAANIPTIAPLLASLAGDIDAEATPLHLANSEYSDKVVTQHVGRIPLNQFLHDQIEKLVDQEGVRSLLLRSDDDSSHAQLLAGYALTLLQLFPRHADDIRMWLYLGPPNQDRTAIAYFWSAARETAVFKSIFRDSRAAIELLRAQKSPMNAWQPPSVMEDQIRSTADSWRIILVFLELYTFLLKIMDDEEFLRGPTSSDGRPRNISILDMQDLTMFLKNLGFTMYYNSQEIQPQETTATPFNLGRYFGAPPKEELVSTKPMDPTSVAGITGMSVDYLKGLVTGLLRSIYERDSRRNFFGPGHWLMTSRFDMSNFIQAVVAEEESRHLIQGQENEDEEEVSEEEEETWRSSRHASRQLANAERRARALRKASRKRYMEAVAPRLEILQNMPFLIPFDVRVQIFREFVNLDQHKRRGGFIDADIWRQFVVHRGLNNDPHAELQRHHAKIRRNHEFNDSFDQFYKLGPDLKEPIQITFVDEFDIVEAGIDGGGIQKEFLTSVTSEAFNPSMGLFETNSQHLLYPNPTSIAEQREILRSSGCPESDPEHRAHISALLQRYEFLGRIIGKCLYEGILVDIRFAGFFLLKWALTGGVGAAPKESGYRANINDLRDLDEELYQGLLMLKNYTGNVEDLSLTFVVTDTTPLGNGQSKTVERELVQGGKDKAVTNENRLAYISYVSRYKLQAQFASQTNAFLRGLSSIIQPSWMSMFNQTELQTLIGGAATPVDIPDLRRNTQYGGIYVIGDDRQEHPSVQLFWRVMETMDDEDRRKVLKFVTSTPRAPLLGFGSLNPKFSIRDAGHDETRFPTTSTCVNLLKLPVYKTESALRAKLLYAVSSGAGFDLS